MEKIKELLGQAQELLCIEEDKAGDMATAYFLGQAITKTSEALKAINTIGLT
jgi:hypothetical protein